MSGITATMLQDKLNSIERNAYDGIDFSQEVTAAYVLADELGERIDQLKDENAKLREFATETWELLTCNEPVFVWKELQELARNLEIEVDE